ncbi:MAG: hypothetical protein LC795_13960 [Acidobacteria bacterium]|nr:hypothetical protein [Acidobacteriota bacterium]MCA1620384.1 hypothetical protein [Acidobacteriota bacterium]
MKHASSPARRLLRAALLPALLCAVLPAAAPERPERAGRVTRGRAGLPAV